MIGEDGDAPTETQAADTPEPPYSIYSNAEKKFLVLAVSFTGMISPLSSAIYLPALPEISRDLHVSMSLVNLTITTYLVSLRLAIFMCRMTNIFVKILQGITPSFIGNFSDSYGRRPAYMICSVIYLAANIGLGCNNTYAGLMVLRCLQSAGSSATIALASATVADLVTRAERGKFIGFAGMGTTLGPSLGPVAGGLITQYLGWRAIFWFLAILSGVLFLTLFIFLPETCRAVVGNGSIPSPWWNMSLLGYLRQRRRQKLGEDTADGQTSIKPARRRPNPFAALRILGQKEAGIVLGFGSIMYGGYYLVLTTLSNQLSTRFGFDSVTIGLCYLPIGVGSFTTRWTTGFLIDRNFKRHARKAGYEFTVTRQQDMDRMPIERARLEVSLPLIYLSCCTMVTYGWLMETQASLAAIEVMLFLSGLFFSGALNGLNVLVVDTNPDSPATAVAANNLFRCLVGAGAVALATPLIRSIGIGWTSVIVAGLWVLMSPFVWAVMLRGPKWRREEKEKQERKARRARERDGDVENQTEAGPREK